MEQISFFRSCTVHQWLAVCRILSEENNSRWFKTILICYAWNLHRTRFTRAPQIRKCAHYEHGNVERFKKCWIHFEEVYELNFISLCWWLACSLEFFDTMNSNHWSSYAILWLAVNMALILKIQLKHFVQLKGLHSFNTDVVLISWWFAGYTSRKMFII